MPDTKVNATSISARRKAAGLDQVVKMDVLADHSFRVTAAQDATATLPDGTESTGKMMNWTDLETGEKYRTFVGGVALVRDLTEIELPFDARLEKVGRTWTFVDPE